MTSVLDSEVGSREDSDGPETGSSVSELLPLDCAEGSFSCCPPDWEASGAGSPGPSEVLVGGCVGTVALLGDCTAAGAWLEEGLGRSTVEPEASGAVWGWPEEVTGGWGCCWLAARGRWLEEPARDRGWPRDLPGSREALAGERRGDVPKVVREGAGLLPDEGLVDGPTRECAEESVDDLGWRVPPSSPAGSCVDALGEAFTCPSGADSRLLWGQLPGQLWG